jgi:hypothetical protein
MPSASSIVKKVSGVLKRVGPPTRLVYLRTTALTGADQLTGYPGTAVLTDTLLSPQPYYVRLGRDRVPGPHTHPVDAMVASGNVEVLDDWGFYVSPAALTLAQIEDPSFRLVCKTATEEEVFQLLDMDSAMIYGGAALYTCYMRSTKRT